MPSIHVKYCSLVLFLAIDSITMSARAQDKEVLIVDGQHVIENTLPAPKREQRIMLDRLRSYVYEEYGNTPNCYSNSPFLPDDHLFIAGSFTRPHAKQYATAYLLCDAGGIAGEYLSGLAVFEQNKIIAVFNTVGTSYLPTITDIDKDGKNEIIMPSGMMHMGEVSGNFSITEVNNNQLIDLYHAGSYDEYCGSPKLSHDVYWKYYLTSGKQTKMRIEEYTRTFDCLESSPEKPPYKLIKTRTEIVDVNKIRAMELADYQRNHTNDLPDSRSPIIQHKMDFHNHFEPFYSIQLASTKRSIDSSVIASLVKTGCDPIDYEGEEDYGTYHYLLGRFPNKASAIAAYTSIKHKIPKKLRPDKPLIRYFDGRHWSLANTMKPRSNLNE